LRIRPRPATEELSAMPLAMQSLLGFLVLFVFAWAISEKRGAISWRTVLGAVILQIVMLLLMFKFPWFKDASAALNDALNGVAAATRVGTNFVFGYLGASGNPADAPFPVKDGGSTFILMTMALPLIIVVSALSSLLFYWGILPVIVNAFSWVLKKTIGIGGAVGVSTAANIFLGTVEAPLFIKPYLAKLSRGELFITMVGGMAGIAGTVMVIYSIMLVPVVPTAAGHILIVSFISAPAAVAFSALMVPHEGPVTDGDIIADKPSSSMMDAITQGTVDGVGSYINVAAMLIVLTALIALTNMILGIPFDKESAPTLQGILGWIMRPVVWLIGVPWNEAQTAGSLMGTKTVLNEFIAFLDMAKLPPGTLSERSNVIMIYALCGFANFASIGIMIGGLGTICPERRNDIIDLGYKSLIGGSLATLSCGALVGIIY
jgi:CNT family concentrative nucleoside transporter